MLTSMVIGVGTNKSIPREGQPGHSRHSHTLPFKSRIATADPSQKQIQEIKAIGERVAEGRATSEDVFKLRGILERLPSAPVGKNAKVLESALQTLVLIAAATEDDVIRSQAANGVGIYDSTGTYLEVLARNSPVKVQAKNALALREMIEAMARLP